MYRNFSRKKIFHNTNANSRKWIFLTRIQCIHPYKSSLILQQWFIRYDGRTDAENSFQEPWTKWIVARDGDLSTNTEWIENFIGKTRRKRENKWFFFWKSFREALVYISKYIYYILNQIPIHTDSSELNQKNILWICIFLRYITLTLYIWINLLHTILIWSKNN